VCKEARVDSIILVKLEGGKVVVSDNAACSLRMYFPI
jgi:hypothetical protein